MDKNQEHNHAVAESSDSDLARLRAMLGTAENLEPTHLRVEQYALDGKHFLRMEIAAPPWQPAGHDLARRPMPKVVSFVVFVFDAAGRLLQFEADAFPR